MPSCPASPPTRRTVLRAAAVGATAALLAGCSDLGRLRWGDHPTPPPRVPDDDELARRRAATSATTLAAACRAAAAARPDLEPVLGVVAAEHDAHLVALGPPPPTQPTGPTPTPTPTATPATALPALEATAAAQALADAITTSPGLARLLTSVGAARWVHATALAGALGEDAPLPPAPPTAVPPVDGLGAATALTAVLDGEYAAIHTYEVLAARLADSHRDRALTERDAHRALAEQCAAWLSSSRLDVPVPAPAYEVPPLPTPADAVAHGGTLEDQLAARAALLVTDSTNDLRAAASTLLVQRALAAYRWRGSGAPFPGIPEAG